MYNSLMKTEFTITKYIHSSNVRSSNLEIYWITKKKTEEIQ